MIDFEQFKAAIQPHARYGLTENQAREMCKTKATADFFEETVLNLWFIDYKKSGLPIHLFALMLNSGGELSADGVKRIKAQYPN